MPASFPSSRLTTHSGPVIRGKRPVWRPQAAPAPESDLSCLFFFVAIDVREGRKRGLLFHPASYRATLAAWPAPPPSERPAHRSSLKRCSVSRGPFRAVLPSMTSRHGASPMIGPIPFRSRLPKSKCSSAGSAICSTSFFPHPSKLTLRRVP